MTSKTITEPERQLSVLCEYDVAVVGGGPAGCAAAAAAAASGAKTILLEKEGFLGGATVIQTVAVILSTNGADFQGIWHEYIRRLQKRDGVRPFTGSAEQGQIRSCVDPEMVKYVWDELLTEAGADILHHVYGCTAYIDEGCAKGVIAETRAGRQVILADRVIDCTGDGIVAAQSGVGYDAGDGENPWAMACTKVFRMGNLRRRGERFTEEELAEIRKNLEAACERGEFTTPVITTIDRLMGYIRGWHWELPERRNETLSVISRVLKVDPLDPFDFTRAEREGRDQAWQASRALLKYVPGFEEAYLLDTNMQIGLRSSRRLHGIETVTDEDAWDFHKYPDSIARSSWNIDIWPADSYTKPAVPRGEAHYVAKEEGLKNGEYFDIRYGCLVAKGVDNLLMGGRCISAGHKAEASLRIQQTCMSTGEAAGVGATLSLEQGKTPAEVDAGDVVKKVNSYREKFERNFP